MTHVFKVGFSTAILLSTAVDSKDIPKTKFTDLLYLGSLYFRSFWSSLLSEVVIRQQLQQVHTEKFPLNNQVGPLIVKLGYFKSKIVSLLNDLILR